MFQSDTEQASTASSQDGPEAPRYTLADIVSCMRNSAAMLELVSGKPRWSEMLQKHVKDEMSSKQAALLYAAADDLELRI